MRGPIFIVNRLGIDGRYYTLNSDSSEVPLIRHCIGIAFLMLFTKKAKSVLKEIALDNDRAQPTCSLDDHLADASVEVFLSAFHESLPTVIIDDTLAHGGWHGFHQRLPEQTGKFKPQDHYVNINGAVSISRRNTVLSMPDLTSIGIQRHETSVQTSRGFKNVQI